MKHLFWIDMEMSGLNPNTDRILEVALVITDLQFNVVETYENIVFQAPEVLKGMDEWCTKHHKESGLTDKVPQGKPQADVESDLVALFQKYDHHGKSVLAGNSIGQDRKFIDQWMPKLAAQLHYRMCDISSFKIIFEHLYNKKMEKKKKHRAIDDILESIEELKFYLQFVKP
jgi:oligoribonuclease